MTTLERPRASSAATSSARLATDMLSGSELWSGNRVDMAAPWHARHNRGYANRYLCRLRPVGPSYPTGTGRFLRSTISFAQGSLTHAVTFLQPSRGSVPRDRSSRAALSSAGACFADSTERATREDGGILRAAPEGRHAAGAAGGVGNGMGAPGRCWQMVNCFPQSCRVPTTGVELSRHSKVGSGKRGRAQGRPDRATATRHGRTRCQHLASSHAGWH
jgi:hypothetical protein